MYVSDKERQSGISVFQFHFILFDKKLCMLNSRTNKDDMFILKKCQKKTLISTENNVHSDGLRGNGVQNLKMESATL